MPDPIRCDNITDSQLYSSQLNYIDFQYAGPMQTDPLHHNIMCQLEGSKEILLIHPDDIDGWADLEPTVDGKSGLETRYLNALSLDLDSPRNKPLANIRKFHIASVTENKCAFIPAGWIYQQNVLDMDYSVEVRWNALFKQAECLLNKEGHLTLGDFPFRGDSDPRTPKEKTTDWDRTHIDTMVPIMETYFIKKGERSYEEFTKKIAKDQDVIERLPEWNDECETVVKKHLFPLLDRNRDKKLSAADLAGMGEIDMTFWLGQVSDQLETLAEIAYDMRTDRGPRKFDPDELRRK